MESTAGQGQDRSTDCSGNSSITSRKRGRCKWFNVTKGWGFITLHDGSPDVFVHQSVIRMNGFRNLAEGEEVELETKYADKGAEATIVTGPGGTECRGSHRQPRKQMKSKRIRCYNCGVVGSHIAPKCTVGPQPKRCHQCKSEEHLISDCPSKFRNRSIKRKERWMNLRRTKHQFIFPRLDHHLTTNHLCTL